MDNLIGKTLGQYQVIEMAGKGGMATVYKAYQPSLNRYVALKVLPDYLAQDDQFVARFEQEARAAAALRHPNIMVVYDVGREGNTHYIAAEFLEGSTLAQVITQRGGPLPLQRTVNIITQLASALDFAHQRGLVHRDVKPSNAFIGPDDHVTLMDFGIVKALLGGAQMTRTGAAIGTPEYMSPEQGEGHTIDQRSDIYSLGVVLYQLLTGRVPFQAETPTAVLIAHLTKQPQPPAQLNPAIPPAVEAVVMRALAKRPEDRFATAGEMARALAQAASGASAPAYMAPTALVGQPPTTPPPYTPPPAYTAPPGYTAPPPPPSSYGPQPYTPPPVARKSGGANWLLWAGLGAAGLALICILGFVGLYVLGSSGGTSTPTPTRSLVRATATGLPIARATSTALPKPTSSAGVLFNDDFSSQQASEDKGWIFDTGENVDSTWAANKFIITVKKKQWLSLNWPDGTYDDFGVEAEAQPMSDAYAEYGINFRVNGDQDTRSYYIFGISTEGKYYLQKKLNGTWADTDPVPSTSSQYIKKGTTKNTLGVLAQGSEISLYINGFLVNVVTDDSISDGNVGIYAGTGDNDLTKVAFSRVTILKAEQAQVEWSK